MVKLELVVFDGTDRRFAVEDGAELMVGVEASCTVRLASLDVSRAHALITCQKGRTVLLDLGSTNGTFVNGKRVKEAELRPGDTVRFSSVMAQLMPAGGARLTEDSAPGIAEPAAWDASSSSGAARATTAWQPLLIQEALSELLDRWCEPNLRACEVLAEWLVKRRGNLGAAVLEGVEGEVVVHAAHGEIAGVLKDPQCSALVKSPVSAGSILQSVQLLVAGARVVAAQIDESPWLVLAVGRVMPDSAELPALVRLMRVAARLDRTTAVSQ